MGTLERPATNGSIEQFGASAKISDELVSSYQDRGLQAARLLLLTLTESPHKPVVAGRTYGIEVSNVYQGDATDDAETVDTVVTAQAALTEYLHAKVPGAARLGLEYYRTKYRAMFREVKPGLRVPVSYHSVFDEAFMDQARNLGLDLREPEDGFAIIRQAPRSLEGLRLSDHNNQSTYVNPYQRHDLVTTDGYVINLTSYNPLMRDTPRYYLDKGLAMRTSRAPGSTIAHQIGQRVVNLRTAKTKR